jgi:hypothetical protein
LRNTAKSLIWLLDKQVKNKIKVLALCSPKGFGYQRPLHSQALAFMLQQGLILKIFS